MPYDANGTSVAAGTGVGTSIVCAGRMEDVWLAVSALISVNTVSRP
ncbi:MAG: hypothetical protein V8Q88_06310 [Christensenellales bacterium]